MHLAPQPFAGGQLRLESVQNAVDQAKAVAAAIRDPASPTTRCRGSGATSTRSSCRWWASRPGTTARWCAATRRKGGSRFCTSRMVGYWRSISVNRPGDHMTGRKLLTAGSAVTEAQAADEDGRAQGLVAGLRRWPRLMPRPGAPAWAAIPGRRGRRCVCGGFPLDDGRRHGRGDNGSPPTPPRVQRREPSTRTDATRRTRSLHATGLGEVLRLHRPWGRDIRGRR